MFHLPSILDTLLGEDSEWEAGAYDDTFICPHGDEIEMDGQCPEGCVSPLIEWGIV